MKTAFIPNAVFALSIASAVQAQSLPNHNASAQCQGVVTANKSEVTREQKRQEAIEALRSGVVSGGEGYQSQLYAASELKVPSQVTREQKRQEAIEALRSGVVSGGERYQSQLPTTGQTKVSREAVRAAARAAAHTMNGCELNQ